jgi:predicted nucleic acid-binding protein
LADESDQFHRKAVELLPKLAKNRTISELVLSESVTGVGARLGSGPGKEVFDNLLYDPMVKVVFGSKRLYERAVPIYLRYGGILSFSDALSVRIMLDQKIAEIASFDSEFDRVEGITRAGF